MSLSLYFSFYILEIKLRSFTFQTSSLFLNYIQNVFLNVDFETESSCINLVGLEHTLHLSWPWPYDPPILFPKCTCLQKYTSNFYFYACWRPKLKQTVMTVWLQILPTTNLVLRTMRCVYGLLVETMLLI